MVENRVETEQEKAYKRLPFCIYDPIGVRCESVSFPPSREHCDRCIVINISDCLAERETSEVMRWFIAYRKFRDLMEKK